MVRRPQLDCVECLAFLFGWSFDLRPSLVWIVMLDFSIHRPVVRSVRFIEEFRSFGPFDRFCIFLNQLEDS